MDLHTLSQRHGALSQLLHLRRHWQQLDQTVKQVLPANLHSHTRTGGLQDGCLTLLAGNAMAAGRLKMLAPALLPALRQTGIDVREIRVRLQPHTPPLPKQKQLALSAAALDSFRQAEQQLQHHPELAAALRKLQQNHKH